MMPIDQNFIDPLEQKAIVYIIDDDAEVRESLKWLLESTKYRVEDYESGETFLAQFNEDVPSVILCDLRMPGMSGADVQEHLNKRGISVPFIFLTGHGDVTQAVEAFKKGAVDFIQKPYSQAEVKNLVMKMIDRSFEMTRRRRELDHYRSLIECLTPREQQVLERVVNGRLNKQIADDLNISIKTVEAHRASIMDKTNASTVADLMRVVVKSELFPHLSGTLAEAMATNPTAGTETSSAKDSDVRLINDDDSDRLRLETKNAKYSTLPGLSATLTLHNE